MEKGKVKVHIDYLYTLLSMYIKTVRITIKRTNTEHRTSKKRKKQMPVNPKKVRE